MHIPKPFVPPLNIEDLKEGGNQKAIDAIKAGIDLRAAKMAVRQLKRLDLRRTNYEYLKWVLMPLQNGYCFGAINSNTDEPIYRAVRWDTKPNLLGQLGCPPAESVGQGRTNNPGNPMFYGSAGCHSTIMELAPSLGDRLAISKWKTKANLPLITAGYTAAAFEGKAGMSRYENLPWVKNRAINSWADTDGNNLVDEFIAHEFTKFVPKGEEWRYKISAAIAQGILNAHSFGIKGAPAIEIAGILYPSTPNQGNADNVALKPEIANAQLKFVSVQYIEITKKTDEPAYFMRGLDFADSISETGAINWKGSFPSERIAGCDHSARAAGSNIEILDNKGQVVASAPFKLEWIDMEHLKPKS